MRPGKTFCTNQIRNTYQCMDNIFDKILNLNAINYFNFFVYKTKVSQLRSANVENVARVRTVRQRMICAPMVMNAAKIQNSSVMEVVSKSTRRLNQVGFPVSLHALKSHR